MPIDECEPRGRRQTARAGDPRAHSGQRPCRPRGDACTRGNTGA